MQLKSTNIFLQQFFLITIFFKLFMNIWGLHKITVKMPNFYVDISCYLSRNPFMTFTLFWQILWLSNPFVYSKTTPSLLSKKINIMVPISSRILKPFSKNGLLRWTYQTVTVSETTSKAIVRKKHHTFWRKAVLPNVMFFFSYVKDPFPRMYFPKMTTTSRNLLCKSKLPTDMFWQLRRMAIFYSPQS